MLFVDRPDEFDRDLPGFLPGDLGETAPVKGDGPKAGAFAKILCEALYCARSADLMTSVHPAGHRDGFWSDWYLASDSSGSQYDVLRRVITRHRDLPGNVVCLALAGGGLHGQQGRPWQAVRGNLHLTLGIRCDLPAARTGVALTMLPAVAVVDALEELITSSPSAPRDLELGIKWVNDILITGRKLGGVLTSTRSQTGRLTSCVLGIGLNVLATPQVAPTPFTPEVACLSDYIKLPDNGLRVVLDAVLGAVASRFGELVASGPAALLQAYRTASLVLGREVEIHPEDSTSVPPRRGRVQAIGPDLSLTLDDRSLPVTTGRLILIQDDG
jgi:BirA family biotin operon repressor/biotin-[acetyl-CoA-carboxylase] ligase